MRSSHFCGTNPVWDRQQFRLLCAVGSTLSGMNKDGVRTLFRTNKGQTNSVWDEVGKCHRTCAARPAGVFSGCGTYRLQTSVVVRGKTEKPNSIVDLFWLFWRIYLNGSTVCYCQPHQTAGFFFPRQKCYWSRVNPLQQTVEQTSRYTNKNTTSVL